MASKPMKVFISYNRGRPATGQNGSLVRFDRAVIQPIIQAWDFRPGQNFVLRMKETMADSDLTIAVLSEHYLKAEFTRQNGQLPLLGIRQEKSEAHPCSRGQVSSPSDAFGDHLYRSARPGRRTRC